MSLSLLLEEDPVRLGLGSLGHLGRGLAMVRGGAGAQGHQLVLAGARDGPGEQKLEQDQEQVQVQEQEQEQEQVLTQ